jgi:hypothetical protein
VIVECYPLNRNLWAIVTVHTKFVVLSRNAEIVAMEDKKGITCPSEIKNRSFHYISHGNIGVFDKLKEKAVAKYLMIHPHLFDARLKVCNTFYFPGPTGFNFFVQTRFLQPFLLCEPSLFTFVDPSFSPISLISSSISPYSFSLIQSNFHPTSLNLELPSS